jgi:hypothetical protein
MGFLWNFRIKFFSGYSNSCEKHINPAHNTCLMSSQMSVFICFVSCFTVASLNPETERTPLLRKYLQGLQRIDDYTESAGSYYSPVDSPQSMFVAVTCILSRHYLSWSSPALTAIGPSTKPSKSYPHHYNCFYKILFNIMTISIFWVAFIASVLYAQTVCIPCVLIHASQITPLLASGIDMVLVLGCICLLLNWGAEPYFLFLLFHRAFWRCTYYHIPTNALITSFII